jgi:hypothetical protein
MRKHFSIFLLAFVILLWSAFPSYALFVIQLKTGRTLSAESYQIEGNTVILQVGGGSLKISKDEILSIVETKGEVKKEAPAETREEPKDLPRDDVQKPATKGPVTGQKEIAAYLEKRAAIRDRLEAAKKAYFEAGDRTSKERERERMISVSKELFSLEEEVKNKNNGVLPDWWKEN